jgi:hypothetical protein
MRPPPQPWDKLRTYPLDQRDSLTRAEDILVPPLSPPPACSDNVLSAVGICADRIVRARELGAGVILMYGAHLLRNGAALILDQMMERNWLTHLATNGAGTIHDWEYAWLGQSTESVEKNVATGTFGTWDETGRNLHIAMMAGALRADGYGVSLGRFIAEDGCDLPSRDDLIAQITSDPSNPLTAARADMLKAMVAGHVPVDGRRYTTQHPQKEASILASAYRHDVPVSVHPGIGYDIIANHPIFDGAVVGRGAGTDFRLFSDSAATLEGGVVLSVGSAIMAPQVFEKSLSCVNNLRITNGLKPITDLTIVVVDIQDGGGWNWTQGEPPKTNPAYYLRFCKSFSRMGGEMHYVQSDNMAFIHNLYHKLLERETQ